MFLADKQMGKLVNDSFVVVKLDVMESADKKSLENRGGMDFMKQWGGEKAGLPFMAILDANGKKLVDSIEQKPGGVPVGNIGYPARPNEIDWFMTMLGAGRSKLSKAETQQMKSWLTDHAPKM